jgi:hypothetical protein
MSFYVAKLSVRTHTLFMNATTSDLYVPFGPHTTYMVARAAQDASNRKQIARFNRMTKVHATKYAVHMFGGEVWADMRKGTARIMRQESGLCVDCLGEGKTWLDAFRAARRALGLVTGEEHRPYAHEGI